MPFDRIFDRIAASLAILSLGAGLAVGFPIARGALAASELGGYAVRGLGSRDCRDLNALLQGDGAEQIMDAAAIWTAGYASHFNRSTPGVYEALPIVDNRVVAAMALNICGSNPDAMFEAVVAQVIASFEDAALSEESELLRIAGTDGTATWLRREVFRKVQHRLIDEEFLPAGSADGLYGPRTRQALVAFQKRRGIGETGVPDPATLIMLFVVVEARAGEDGVQ